MKKNMVLFRLNLMQKKNMKKNMVLFLLNLMQKTSKLRRLVMGDKACGVMAEGKKTTFALSWITYGHQVVDDSRSRELALEPDKVIARREQISENELWFFGVFDARIDDGVSQYIQAHLFDNEEKLEESKMRRKSEEALKEAHLNVRAKIRETEKAEKAEEGSKLSSATAIVINGEKIVMADMGEYKAVLCRNGVARQINREKEGGIRSRLSRKFIPGAIRRVKERLLGRVSGSNKPNKGSELLVGSERVDPDTEFLILASNGIWEVMQSQEAVNLIRHIENAQEAADLLAKEAVARWSKSSISCLIIRFDWN